MRRSSAGRVDILPIVMMGTGRMSYGKRLVIGEDLENANNKIKHSLYQTKSFETDPYKKALYDNSSKDFCN